MKIAKTFEIINGYIQLYDSEDNEIIGSGAKWEGNFDCSQKEVISLVGAPEEVTGACFVNHNKLTSLAGAPQIILGGFFCNNNKLVNLLGGPQVVQGSYNCSHNELISLAGVPLRIGKDGKDGKKGNGYFDCSYNKLSAAELENIPENQEGAYFNNNV